MYGQVVKLEEEDPYTSLSDARYTVAGILSSMANGIANSNGDHTRGANANNAVTTVEYTMPTVSYGTGVTTVTTPTLTPTTLANIEQSFVELTTVPMTTQPQPVQNQAGFVPPVVSRFRNGERVIPYWPTNSIKMISSGSELTVQPEQQKRKGGRRAKQESCNPEEEERRRIRRERNKLAAAKCRKRRLDHTNTLLMETEHLEEEKHEIENEIAKLQSQKEQLEFILQSHLPSCKHRGSTRLSTPTCPEFKLDGSVHSRPTSLSLSTTSSNGSMMTPANVFTTPSGGTLYNFATSNMDDEHTGLTPVIHPATCSGEACKTSGSSDLSSPEAIRSPTLVSL